MAVKVGSKIFPNIGPMTQAFFIAIWPSKQWRKKLILKVMVYDIKR